MATRSSDEDSEAVFTKKTEQEQYSPKSNNRPTNRKPKKDSSTPVHSDKGAHYVITPDRTKHDKLKKKLVEAERYERPQPKVEYSQAPPSSLGGGNVEVAQARIRQQNMLLTAKARKLEEGKLAEISRKEAEQKDIEAKKAKARERALKNKNKEEALLWAQTDLVRATWAAASANLKPQSPIEPVTSSPPNTISVNERVQAAKERQKVSENEEIEAYKTAQREKGERLKEKQQAKAQQDYQQQMDAWAQRFSGITSPTQTSESEQGNNKVDQAPQSERAQPQPLPEKFLCPISLMPMEHPMIAPDGCTYDLDSLSKWLAEIKTSPSSKMEMQLSDCIPDYKLAKDIAAA
eukprot:Ihof_evm26s1 gene=Ihof_evmTU26s1